MNVRNNKHRPTVTMEGSDSFGDRKIFNNDCVQKQNVYVTPFMMNF